MQKRKKNIAINTPAISRVTFSFNVMNLMLAETKKMRTKDRKLITS